MFPRMGARVLCSAAMAATLAASPAAADLYGFVDENGVSHFSDAPLDHRYILFRKSRKDPAQQESRLVVGRMPGAAPRRPLRINPAQRRQYSPLVAEIAWKHKLSPALLHAVITVESGYNPKARSSKGASGLMQLMPATARRYSVTDIWDPQQNVDGGARYLRDLLALFNNDLTLALAAYNAGEGAVIQHGNRVPPYPETRNYVPQVLQHYQLYATTRR